MRTYRKPIGLAALAVLLVLACYAPTISLPYFWDDIPHFLLVTSGSYLDVWTNKIGYGYYRPLVFSLYKWVFETLPFGATAWPHIAILVVHGLSSFLVGRLCRRLWTKQAPDGLGADIVDIAGILAFALFPFAALPVVHFAAAMHPLVTFVTLCGVIAALKFAETNRRAWLGIAMLAAIAAPYLHEAGVMAGSVMALAWVVHEGRPNLRRTALIAILPVLSAAFLVIWLSVPKAATAGVHLGGWDELLAKVTFFSQGLTYPLLPIGTYLIHKLQWWDVGAMLAVGFGSLALAAWALYAQRLWKPLMLAAGWLGLTTLPTVVALPFSYMITSPRLIYFPGVSGAILWSSVIAACFTNRKHRWVQWSLGAVWLAATVAFPIAYIQREVRVHVLALTPLRQLDEIARQYPAERHLVVNSVSWLAYQNPIYPMGHEGVTVWADYILPAQLVLVNTGINLNVHFVAFGDLQPTFKDYYLSTLGDPVGWELARDIGRYDKVWLTKYVVTNATTELVGHVDWDASLAAPANYLARFEDKAYLVKADYEPRGGSVTLTLDWLFPTPALRPDATIFANVFDCEGNVVGLDSGHALGKMLLVSAMPAGALVHDIRHVALDRLPADNCYQIELGFFVSDGTRMTAYAPDGSQYDNRLYLLHH